MIFIIDFGLYSLHKNRIMNTRLYLIVIWSLTFQLVQTQASYNDQVHTVGFSSEIKIDKSRPSTADDNFGRIIQINIWYPGNFKSGATRIDFSDYLKLRGSELGINKPNENYKKITNKYFKWPISQGANPLLIDSIMSVEQPMKALENIDFKPGKHPVILLMHGSAVDFAFLGEALAEQGYIAVNVPIQGYRQEALNVNSIGMETEIRDFEFAMSVLSNNKALDLNTITALGFSFGGQSAIGLACRNPKVKTVISYDGGIGDKFGARLINESHFCSTENISASVLHIYDNSYSGVYLDKIRSFVYADRTLIGLKNIKHWHFTSFGHLVSKYPNLFGDSKFDINGYKTILKITANYLYSKEKGANLISSFKDKFELINDAEFHKGIKTK